MNNASAILYISFANRTFLICGDNEQESLRAFTDRWVEMHVDVLLAPHHGQQSGFNAGFVKHVDPDWVIISSGSRKDCDAYDNYANLAHQVRARLLRVTGRRQNGQNNEAVAQSFCVRELV